MRGKKQFFSNKNKIIGIETLFNIINSLGSKTMINFINILSKIKRLFESLSYILVIFNLWKEIICKLIINFERYSFKSLS